MCLFCACNIYIQSRSVPVCFAADWIRFHEIEHFFCWFAVKWCACVGLRRVSFSIKSNRAVTERRGGEEERGGSVVYLLLLLLPLQSIRQSEQCAIWINFAVKTDACGNTNSTHVHAHMHTKHWVTCACLCTHAERVRSGAKEGGRTWKLNKQSSVNVMEGEPPSDDRIERTTARGMGGRRIKGCCWTV